MAQLTPEQRAKIIAELKARGVKIQKAEPVKEPNYIQRSIVDPRSSSLAGVVSHIGETIDPYTGAPVRAAVGELQSGRSGKEAIRAFGKQITAGEVLPTTPSGEDLVYKDAIQKGHPPELAREMATKWGPWIGAGLDWTHVLSAVPVARVTTAVGKGLAKAGKPVGEAVTKGIFKVGQVATIGELDAAKALKASKELSPVQQMTPFHPAKEAYKGSPTESQKALKQLIQFGGAYPTGGKSVVLTSPDLYHGVVGAGRGTKQFVGEVKGALGEPGAIAGESALKEVVYAPGRVDIGPMDLTTAIEPESESVPILYVQPRRKK